MRGQPPAAAGPGGHPGTVPARVHLPRTGEPQAPVRRLGRGRDARRHRAGSARRGRLVADRRLLGIRVVRSDRLRPRRRRPGQRTDAPSMPATGPAPRPSSAVTAIPPFRGVPWTAVGGSRSPRRTKPLCRAVRRLRLLSVTRPPVRPSWMRSSWRPLSTRSCLRSRACPWRSTLSAANECLRSTRRLWSVGPDTHESVTVRFFPVI